MTDIEQSSGVPDIQKLLNESMAPLLEKIDELEKSNASIMKAYEDAKQMNAAMIEEKKLMDSAKTEFEAFKQEREAEKAIATKEQYKKLLNAANQVPDVFEKLYPEMQVDLPKWLNENQDKIYHPADETKLGGKSVNQGGTPDYKALAHAKLASIGV